MHVSVSIVGFRNADDVLRCVSALAQCDYSNFDIVICENGGADSFGALQASLPFKLAGGQRLYLVQAPGNGGYASGVNLCMANSPDSDAWWILNPDTEPSRSSMSALVKCLADGWDAAGGPLYLPNGTIQSFGGLWWSWFARSVAIGNGARHDDIPDAVFIARTQSYLSGASMMVSRRFLSSVGPMREDFFLYCEEIDWCLEATRRGMKLGFAPEARVLHRQGTTTGNELDTRARSRLSVYLDERNKMLLTLSHFPLRLPVAALAAFFLIGLRYLRKGALRQFGYGVQGWFAGLKGERGKPPWMAER
jgi:hypothetical protein